MPKDDEKKVKQAVALEYDPEDKAPRVVAMGRGALAEKIIEQAQQAQVPVHKDEKLADTLSKLQIGDMIPPELYEVVAQVLLFVDNMDKIKAKVAAHQSNKNSQA
ncbi:MAG: EscU/YscU/HrcU family type III secretion system export apparatus switch protein [Lachnospiraceae bacterium]|nr:EscU/YscU/HrcU family type III secretion system export apparatus switch protein [Lachnospiraceae bacterium]